jgi:hypothetical protein
MSELSDLGIADLRSVLAEQGSQLTPQQVLAIKDFIQEVGSLEEATLALELLDKRSEAA